MKKLIIRKIFPVLVLTLLLSVLADTSIAQIEEPDVIETTDPKTPLSEGYQNSLGFDLFINNFGFGIGGTYGRAVAPFTEITFRTGITGIRDVSEQNFQSFLTGQQIIPNKYKRALGFPFLLGVKQRLFARQIEDNMRVFISASGGPALTFSYPYVSDVNDNGFRDFYAYPTQRGQVLRPVERVNDFFSGWGEGETQWGVSGAFKIGVDIGSSFGSVTTVEFGYFFYYFKEGLQIMEPYKPFGYTQPTAESPGIPVAVQDGERNPFFDAQKYFGTPQIKFTFGGMW